MIRTAQRQKREKSRMVSKRSGFLMKRRSASAVRTPLAESIAKVTSRNQGGVPYATGENRRMGRVPASGIHQLAGRISKRAQSRTESGNQKGDALARLNDIPYR